MKSNFHVYLWVGQDTHTLITVVVHELLDGKKTLLGMLV